MSNTYQMPVTNAIYGEGSHAYNRFAQNEYMNIMGEDLCQDKCLTPYANIDSNTACPSSCDFEHLYAKLPNYYSKSTVDIPASTASRILKTSFNVDDYKVYNDRVVNFDGKVESPSQYLNKPSKESFRYFRKKNCNSAINDC